MPYRTRAWTRRLRLAAAALTLSLAAARGESVGCYISSGDNDWLWTSPPVNSKASIEAFFDVLRRAYGVSRIYWRGSHAEWVIDHMVVRPENFLGAGFWRWEQYLIQKRGQSDLAVAAARARGMEIWGFNPLFDAGAPARSDACKQGAPSPVEWRLRIEHPEIVPIDRAGLRRQAGPVEFAYPLARREFVRQIVDIAARRGYDGIMFYTYVEHCSMRFQDEFGFNAPIVQEYRRRYGRDIRRETFDKHAWARLRGEYVTQLVRELSAALHARGKKLGVAIDPQNTHLPAPWLCLRRDFRPTGRIYLDWERWVREGLVDEIMVYCNGPLEKAVNAALAATKGTRCAVSALHSAAWPPEHQHFARVGVRRVMAGGYQYFEWGAPEPQPASAIDSADFLRRLRVLRQVEEKKTTLPFEKLAAAARDPNVLVRRQALRALQALGDPRGAAVAEAALNDPETGVRCAAAAALCKLHRAGTAAKLFAALRARPEFQFENAVDSTLANLPAARTREVLAGLSDASAVVRRVTARALGHGLRRNESVPALLNALNDPDPSVRFYAANALARFTWRRDVADALLARLDDPHPSVRNRAALAAASCFRSHSRWISARQLAAARRLSRLFRECAAADDWSFRPEGRALAELGPRGRDALQRFMDQREDKTLADRAWRILFAPQIGWRYALCSEKEALAGYRRHPVLSGWKPAKRAAAAPEPARMPYLRQSFDEFKPYCRSPQGDVLSEAGLWRGLGDAPPAPMIQTKVKRGSSGAALRLTRGPAGAKHTAQVLRVDYRLSTERAVVEMWIYRASPRSSFAVTWRDSASSRWYVGAFVAASGKVAVVSGDRRWKPTPAALPPRAWRRIQFDIDGEKRRYTLRVGAEKLVVAAADIPLPAGRTYNILTFVPQPPEGGITYVDDVSVTVPNPARSLRLH